MPLVVRIDADDKRSADNLMLDGWREIEVLETYRGKPDAKTHSLVRRAISGELSDCIKIARTQFHHDRLHADPMVRKAVADEAKEDWVAKCFADPTTTVFVHGHPVDGFLAVKWIGDGLMIDLIATSAQRKRVGTKLVCHAMAELKPPYLRAGTQLANQEGRLFYAALGMTCIKRQRTFHKP